MPAVPHGLLLSLACLFVSLAVASSSFGSHGEQYRGLLALGSILVIASEVWLAWNFRCWVLPQVAQFGPLRSLFATSTLGIVLSYPNLPIPLLTISWTAILLVSLMLLRRQNTQEAPGLEKAIFYAHQCVLWLSLVAALLGWTRLGILLALLVNCLCVSLQLVVGLIQVLNRPRDMGNNDEVALPTCWAGLFPHS